MKGFTLIELMLVILIIVILSGGAFTAYLTFNKSQSTGNDARNFAAEIYRVRTLAASLQYPTGCSSLKGYNLQSNNINGELIGITLTVDCDPVDVTNSPTQILTSSVFGQAFDITFLPGSGYLSNGTDTVVTITNKVDQTIFKTVTIGAYGVVTNN